MRKYRTAMQDENCETWGEIWLTAGASGGLRHSAFGPVALETIYWLSTLGRNCRLAAEFAKCQALGNKISSSWLYNFSHCKSMTSKIFCWILQSTKIFQLQSRPQMWDVVRCWSHPQVSPQLRLGCSVKLDDGVYEDFAYEKKPLQILQDTLWWTNILLWKITIFDGKTHYFYGPFPMAMLVITRGYWSPEHLHCPRMEQEQTSLTIAAWFGPEETRQFGQNADLVDLLEFSTEKWLQQTLYIAIICNHIAWCQWEFHGISES